mmetsp:Transcript_36531/g.77740  ORF Transcript_36531/g.77740 Transcript_36531/m.77740 type:complete len:357 (-) Transcript_36531:70-1140(-)
MNFEDVGSSFQVGQAKLDLAVKTTRTQEGWVERVGSVRGHQNLDVSSSLETIQLIHNLQHRSLDLAIVASSGASDGVDLIDEEDASLLRPCQLEELSNHSGTLTDVTLHQFGANDADEAGISPIRNCSSCQGLACTRGTVQENTFRGIDAQCDESLRLQQRHLDDLSQPLQLVLSTANIVVSHIRFLLHSHHGNARINFGRKGNLDPVLAAMRSVDTDAHALFNVCGSHLLSKTDDKFGELTNFDDVLGVVRARVDDLGAASDLQSMFLFHHLFVALQIPLARWSKASVGLLDANQLVDFADVVLGFLLHLFDGVHVRAHTIGSHDVDIILIQVVCLFLVFIIHLIWGLLGHRLFQ